MITLSEFDDDWQWCADCRHHTLVDKETVCSGVE